MEEDWFCTHTGPEGGGPLVQLQLLHLHFSNTPPTQLYKKTSCQFTTGLVALSVSQCRSLPCQTSSVCAALSAPPCITQCRVNLLQVQNHKTCLIDCLTRSLCPIDNLKMVPPIVPPWRGGYTGYNELNFWLGECPTFFLFLILISICFIPLLCNRQVASVGLPAHLP